MAGIQEYLTKILHAVFGRDVRQSIHDAIQQCYYDGKAGSIDLQARQEIETLASRMDNIVLSSTETLSGYELVEIYAYSDYSGSAVIEDAWSTSMLLSTTEQDEVDWSHAEDVKIINVGAINWNEGASYPDPEMYKTLPYYHMDDMSAAIEMIDDAYAVRIMADDATKTYNRLYVKIVLAYKSHLSIPELEDLKVGADGAVYGSAGAAVRAQVGQLYEQMDVLNQGGLNLKEDFIGQQVDEWLDKHPEATTTVQDGVITESKLHDDLKKVIAQKIYRFDNVADMQQYSLKEGDTCITLGYYAKNDGGGTTYNVADTQSDYYETLNNGLYANQIADTNDVVNALTIGFHRNDDIPNDEIYSKYVDVYKHLYFPRGRYKFNDTIYMTSRQEITGCTNPFLGSTTDRFFGTIFDFTGTSDSSEYCIDMFGAGDTTRTNGAMLRGITLYADTLVSTQNRDNAFTDTAMLTFTISQDLSGVRTSNSAKIDNCCFIGFGKAGIFQSLCGFTVITNCQFFKCNYGAILHTDNIVDNIRGYFCNIGVYCRSLNTLSNVRFDSVKIGAFIEGNGCTITGLIVDYSEDEGLYISGDSNTIIASFYRVGMCNNDAGVGLGRHKVFINTGKGNNLNIGCKGNIILDNGETGYTLPKHVRFNTGVSNVNINLSDDSDEGITIDALKKKFFFGKDNIVTVNYNGTPILFNGVSYNDLTTDNTKTISYDGTVPN